VEDNGIGFDESYLDQIFKPFKRLHGKKSRYEGTGIGLAICRKVVEMHRGTLTARSTPGVGSKFIITLPLTQGRVSTKTGHTEKTAEDGISGLTKADLLSEICRLTEQLREPEEVITAIKEG
jgi:hypothetical protein